MGSDAGRWLEKTGGTIMPKSEFESFVETADGADELRKSLNKTASLPPDRAASIVRLSRKTRFPEHVIETDLEGFQEATTERIVDPLQLQARSPRIAQWLATNPYHAAVARDDIERLERLEDAVRGAGFFRNLGKGVGSGLILMESGIGHALEAIGDLASTGRVTGSGAEMLRNAQSSIASTARGLGGVVKRDALENAEFYRGRVQSFRDVEGIADLRDYLAYQLGQGVGSMASVVAGSVAGGAAGAMAVGGTMAFGDVRGEIEELGPEGDGVKNALALGLAIPIALLDRITPGQIASTLIARGVSERIVKEAAQYGLTRSVATAVLRSAATEGGTEVAQEIVQYVGTRTGTGTTMSAGEAVTRGVDAAIGGALGGGTFGGAAGTVEAVQAQRNMRFFQALGETASESQLAKRLPEKMEELVGQLTKDGPVETMYAPIEKFTTYFQSVGMDPAQVAEDVLGPGGREAYGEAVTTGGDLPIPTARYAVTLAPTEHHKALVEELRFRPMEMNVREVREQAEAVAKEQDATADQDRPKDEESAALDEASAAVEAHFMEQLAGANVREREAAPQAKIWRAMARTLASEVGMLPIDIIQKYGLGVRRVDRRLAQPETAGDMQLAAQEAEQGPLDSQFWQSYITTLSPEESTALRAQLEGTGFASDQGAATVTVPQGQRIAGADDTVSMMSQAVRQVGRTRFQQLAQAEIDRRGGGDVDVQKAAIEETARRIVAEPETYFQSVSTRVPTAQKATEDALTETLIVGLESSKADPEAFAKNTEVVAGYVNMRPAKGKKAQTPEAIAEQFIEHVKDNLTWLFDQVPEQIRERSKLWYVGARAIVDEWTTEFGITDVQASGVLAVLSPQKDWFQNVSLARRVVEIWTQQQDTAWTPQMETMLTKLFEPKKPTKKQLEAAAKRAARPAPKKPAKPKEDILAALREEISGKKLSEIKTQRGRAAWVRVYDQVNNPRSFPLVMPEGRMGGPVLSLKGKPKRVAWGSLSEIGKAISILNDGSIENVSARLGGMHKVRNFYNNIFDPFSALQDVTIDTHAVAAGLVRPLSGQSKEVSHNFGSGGVASSSVFGSKGTYGLYAEAYRRAAQERNVLAREMQSITWEAVRGLFTAPFKAQASNVKAINELWRQYQRGELTLEQVREQVVERAGGVADPDWVGSDLGGHEGERGATDAGALPGVGVPGGRTRPAPGRALGLATGRTEDLTQSAPAENGGVAASETFNQPAYHGSPHIFDKFSLHAIGTGEGAQAYGWGLYFTSKKEIAKYYRETLSGGPRLTTDRLEELDPRGYGDEAFDLLWEVLDSTDGFVNQAADRLQDRIESGLTGARKRVVRDALKLLKDLKADYAPSEGRLYKVEIPDDDTMLHWDKPLSEQPAKIRAALERVTLTEYATGRVDLKGWDGLTGGELYIALTRKEDGTNDYKPVSLELGSLGINGIKYRAGEDKTASNYVIFDDSLVQIAEYEQRTPEGPRGAIRIARAGELRLNITLYENANLSTFLHETGHAWLEIYNDFAQQPGAPERVKRIMADIRKALDLKDGEAIEERHHEEWARLSEAYFREGKAPTAELQTAFGAFRAWLMKLYQHLIQLDVNLTPEVRDIFDRMLATDAELERARSEQHQNPLFNEPRELEAIEDANRVATEMVAGVVLAAQRREETAQWKADREAMRKEVEAEVAQEPVQIARAVLVRDVMPDGTPVDPRIIQALTQNGKRKALSKEALLDMVDDATMKQLNRFNLYSKEGGIHPDIAAEWFGYPSGLALVRDLAQSEKFADRVDRITDERMLDLYGDPMTDGTLAETAMEAVHTEKRRAVLKRQFEVLFRDHLTAAKSMTRKMTRRMPRMEAVKAEAERVVGAKKMRDIRPIEYQRAEARAARNAQDAFFRGDFERVYDEKVKELFAFEMYRASTAAREVLEKTQDEVALLFRSDERLAKSRDMDYVSAARAIAAAYGMGRADKAPADYLAQVKQYDVDTYDNLVAAVDAAMPRNGTYRDVRDATLDEIVEFRETVKSLWNLSLESRQYEVDGQKRDREEIREELMARLRFLGTPHGRLGYDKKVKGWGAFKLKLMGGRAALRMVESWVDAMDSGDPQGVFRRYFWNPISDAAVLFRSDKAAYLTRYLERVKMIEPGLTGKPIEAPEIGYTFDDKAELLGAILHTGNESNLDKLIRGREWSLPAWQLFVSRMQQEGVLTKADYDFVQWVWDLFEELKVGAQKSHRQLYGRYFSEITAQTVVTPWGEYRGGYVPARTDTLLVEDAAIRDEKNVLEQGGNSFMFPSTGKGFTKSRVDQYAAPLLMDLRMVPSHIDAVLRFTHLQPKVVMLGRILANREFRKTLGAFDPAVAREMLSPWLQRTATQQMTTPTGTGAAWRMVDDLARGLRNRTGLNIMAANMTNAFQQVTGLFVSAVKVKPRFLRNALWRYIRDPQGVSAEIDDLSPFMAGRVSAKVVEVQQHIDDLLLNPNSYQKARDFATKHGYFLQSAFQGFVDRVAWAGAYEQAVEGGATGREAVRQADSAVRLTQGSFAPEDVARFQTGSPVLRLFSMFSGFFNTMANLQGTEFIVAARELGLRKGAGRMFYAYLMATMIPGVLSEVIVQAARGEPIDEDEDGYMDDFLSAFFGAQARMVTAMVPFVGPTITAVYNQFNDKWYDDRISTSPVVTTLESTVRTPRSVYKAIFDEGNKKTAVKDVLTAVSVFTGLPFNVAARPAGYLIDVQEGKAEPTGAVDFTRGLLTGRPGGSP